MQQHVPSHLVLPSPEHRTIHLAGSDVPYTLKISKRASRLRLIVHPTTGLEVRVPPGTPLARTESVLREKAEWITRTLAQMAQKAPPLPPLLTRTTLPFYGAELHLALLIDPSRASPRIIRTGDTLAIHIPARDEVTLRAALEAWYRRQARRIFAERLIHCNASYKFTYQRVSIKDQQSRWGSCSRQGNLNFNWRLLLAPQPILDYVVIHELAHLREPNHSPRFWALVARTCPNHREQRYWLRDHGHSLRF